MILNESGMAKIDNGHAPYTLLKSDCMAEYPIKEA
jgi:hypothetical protein